MITQFLQQIVQKESLLPHNQLGAIKATQGSKELALLNASINYSSNHSLAVAWLDCAKAYDSVYHHQILKTTEELPIPDWSKKFIKKAIESWSIDILLEGKPIIYDKQIKRGIMQGDSLSPLLFCLSITDVSKKLNEADKVEIRNFETHTSINHLIYMDDIKLFANSKKNLEELIEIAEESLEKIGLNLNRKKCATNLEEEITRNIQSIEDRNTYRYLGFDELKDGKYSQITAEKIEEEIMKRIDLLLETNLSAKNIFLAINEWALSLLDYHSGVLSLSENWYKKLDQNIRKKLTEKHYHLTPACTERLYLKRTDMGRGLVNAVHRTENSTKNLRNYLESAGPTPESTQRRRLILNHNKSANTRLSRINDELSNKYNIVNLNGLKQAQRNELLSKIANKPRHRELFTYYNGTNVDKRSSTTWLRKGNTSPAEEAALCLMQDRNMFWIQEKECPHCKLSEGSPGHIATKCKRLLPHEYKRRHDEIVRCLGMRVAKNLGLDKTKAIKNFRPGEVLENKNAKLWIDTKIKTEMKITHNKPDLLSISKAKSEAMIADVRICGPENISEAENDKIQKYDTLASEIQSIYKIAEVKILPLIFTWDGLISNRTARSLRYMGLAMNEIAYLQTRIIKRTLETMSLGERRSLDDRLLTEDVNTSIRNLQKNLTA